MAEGMITVGTYVTITATGEGVVVVAPGAGAAYKLYNAESNRWNIPVYSVLLDSGEVRQYTRDALSLAE